jgi:hypothetical protein
MKPIDVARMMNKTVISQAREYVWGKDFSQLAIIRRKISTAPDREVITEEARQQAIDAAKGLEVNVTAQAKIEEANGRSQGHRTSLRRSR